VELQAQEHDNENLGWSSFKFSSVFAVGDSSIWQQGRGGAQLAAKISPLDQSRLRPSGLQSLGGKATLV
jgi:hypothetical protein